MAKIDNRSLDHKVLEHMRLLAVDRVLAGEKPSIVAKSFGIYRTSIYKWLRAHRKRGRDALRSTKAEGPTPKLTESQKNQVRRWIIGKDPRQYGFDFGLWTRSIIAQMVRERFDVSLTLPSIGRLLSSLDITPQKPLRRAYERNEKEIKRSECQGSILVSGIWRDDDRGVVHCHAKRPPERAQEAGDVGHRWTGCT